MKVGGRQVIKTVDRYYLPINIIQRLPYIQMEPNTAEEFDTLPHVILTQGGEWDPTALDHILTDDDDWVSKVKRSDDQEDDSPFDIRGEYKHREPVKAGVQVDNPTGPPNKDPDDIEVNFHAADATMEIHQAHQEVSNLSVVYVYEGEGMPDDEVETVEEEDETKEDLEANTPPVETKTKPIDYSKYRRQFLHVPVEKIKRTSITAELLAGARALSLADRHHFELNLSDLLDKSMQYKRNWLLNVIAARQRFERQQANFEGNQTPSIANSKLIKWTFEATTQNAATVVHGPKANQTFKSPNPALNIH